MHSGTVSHLPLTSSLLVRVPLLLGRHAPKLSETEPAALAAPSLLVCTDPVPLSMTTGGLCAMIAAGNKERREGWRESSSNSSSSSSKADLTERSSRLPLRFTHRADAAGWQEPARAEQTHSALDFCHRQRASCTLPSTAASVLA